MILGRSAPDFYIAVRKLANDAMWRGLSADEGLGLVLPDVLLPVAYNLLRREGVPADMAHNLAPDLAKLAAAGVRDRVASCSVYRDDPRHEPNWVRDGWRRRGGVATRPPRTNPLSASAVVLAELLPATAGEFGSHDPASPDELVGPWWVDALELLMVASQRSTIYLYVYYALNLPHGTHTHLATLVCHDPRHNAVFLGNAWRRHAARRQSLRRAMAVLLHPTAESDVPVVRYLDRLDEAMTADPAAGIRQLIAYLAANPYTGGFSPAYGDFSCWLSDTWGAAPETPLDPATLGPAVGELEDVRHREQASPGRFTRLADHLNLLPAHAFEAAPVHVLDRIREVPPARPAPPVSPPAPTAFRPAILSLVAAQFERNDPRSRVLTVLHHNRRPADQWESLQVGLAGPAQTPAADLAAARVILIHWDEYRRSGWVACERHNTPHGRDAEIPNRVHDDWSGVAVAIEELTKWVGGATPPVRWADLDLPVRVAALAGLITAYQDDVLKALHRVGRAVRGRTPEDLAADLVGADWRNRAKWPSPDQVRDGLPSDETI